MYFNEVIVDYVASSMGGIHAYTLTDFVSFTMEAVGNEIKAHWEHYPIYPESNQASQQFFLNGVKGDFSQGKFNYFPYFLYPNDTYQQVTIVFRDAVSI